MPDPVDVRRLVRRLGGSATAEQLLRRTTRHRLAAALAQGEVTRVAHGRYALPELPPSRLAAARAHGVLSHQTAAAEWGLALLEPPHQIHVTVPHGSRPRLDPDVRYHWSPLHPDERRDGLTDPARTVLDCATTLPFDQALAVADSALRDGLTDLTQLAAAAEQRRGPFRARRAAVLRAANGDAANPFESALRAIVVAAGLTGFVPQCPVALPRMTVHVDLGDPARQLALEADSYAHHGSRRDFHRDCRRYDELVAHGWAVLRFSWEQVRFEPDWVAEIVHLACAQRAISGRRC